jgi:hypothetical protein
LRSGECSLGTICCVSSWIHTSTATLFAASGLWPHAKICAFGHISLQNLRKQKTPPERGFVSVFTGGIREAHCVTSTEEVYAIGGDRAISPTVYRIIEYETAR